MMEQPNILKIGSTFVRNVDRFLPDNIRSHWGRQHFVQSTPREAK